jgi:hypothetical protein
MLAYVFLLISAFTWAGSEAIYEVSSKGADSFEVRALSYTNDLGGREIRLESALLPKINRKINSIIGYGRDLDDDGKIETWFLIEQNRGIYKFVAECEDTSCEKTIRNKVFNNYTKSSKMLFYSAYASLMGHLFLSLDNRFQKESDFYKEWIDLEEYQTRLKRAVAAKTPTLTKEQIRTSYEMLIYGYEQNNLMLKKAEGADAWKLLGVDVALWVSGSVVFRLLQKPLIALGAKISASTMGQQLTSYITKFSLAQKKMSNKYIQGFNKKLGGKVTAIQMQKWNRALFKKTYTGGLTAMKMRSRLAEKLAPFKSKLIGSVKAGLSEWKYILLSSSIQLTAETYANYEEVKDRDPLKMAQNVLTHPDIQQNVAYMASETFFMTAAVSSLKTVKSRYAVCGMIAIGNSTALNFFLKDEINMERVLTDTTWEMLIGSSQVQIDVAALTYFEQLSKKKGNPRLKLLGYAVVLVDQGLGYFGYSKLTEHVSEREEKKQANDAPEVKIVPVFAS